MIRPFRYRDPLKLAGAGIALVVVLVGGAVVLPQVVSYTSTATYTAQLAHAAGLRTGDKVYVAGVPSGRVTSITLDGTHVRVEFRLDGDIPLGTSTHAAVKLRTILGKRYLAVKPGGAGRMRPGGVIPLRRTSVPYTLDDLGRSTRQTTEALDLDRLREMMSSLVRAAPDSELTGKALRGIKAASGMLTKYGDQLHRVLAGTQQLASTLLRQKDTLVALLGDAELVASALAAHRDAIQSLVTDLSTLSSQLSSFLDVNAEILGPLVDRLNHIAGTLTANQKALERSLRLLAPTSRYLANATGNGPWLDVNSPSTLVPDNVLCVVGLVKGCR